jgi:hypothetical protein
MPNRRKKPVPVSPKVSPLAVNPQAISFSLKEAAAITGLALWTLRTAVWERRLPARLFGKRQIILRADLEQWLVSVPLEHGRKTRAAA